MARRPIYISSLTSPGVKAKIVEFKWFPGYSISQKQKSITDLHTQGNKQGIANILEISSKSPIDLGVQLSAFNLKSKTLMQGKEFSVETAFQGSKVFQNGGPYTDLIYTSSMAAKKDPRLKNSGSLLKFIFFEHEFGLQPRTLFYDWLYINTLLKNKRLIDNLISFTSFTDIEYNPAKSINCQAFSVALFRSLLACDMIKGDKIDPSHFSELAMPIYKDYESVYNIQTKLIC